MIVFLLHGYPNGPKMYEKLIEELLKYKYVPVALNYRTGVSLEQNVHLVDEVIASYPADIPKTVIAHDWGAYIGWKLLHKFEQYNVKYFVCMSVSFGFVSGSRKNLPECKRMRRYQLILYFSQFLPNCLSRIVQKEIVREKHRNYDYDTPLSAYYYTFWNALKYYMGYDQLFIDPMVVEQTRTKIFFAATPQDQMLGFADEEHLNLFRTYGHKVFIFDNSKHFFINHNENDIYNKITAFISE